MSTPHLPANPNLLEVPVHSLVPGMFIADLDRPWLETPFALQGFLVNDDSDIEYVSKHCNYVYVDPHQQVTVNLNQPRFATKSSQPVRSKVTLKKEFSRASVEFESASVAMQKVFSQIQTSRRVDVTALQSAINPLIDSVMRNKDALMALIRMRDKGDYLYAHSIATVVWASVLGHHIGLDKTSLRKLALATSVMDLGMTSLPDGLVANSGAYGIEEIKQVRTHVKLGVEFLRSSGVDDPEILNVVACHHERHNGSGYPQKLQGVNIPTFARIAGLVDTYDAMLTARPHSPGRSSFEAVQELTDLSGEWFQGSLIEQFIQTIGMYPTGSIVELNTGEVGVVIEQNQQRRLKPTIIVILDKHKSRRAKLELLDLASLPLASASQPAQWIARELQTGAYDIKPDDYFL